MKPNFDVVIIGAGVAGMTAALYLKRAGVSCCIVEKEAPGGQILKTSMIENYPGMMTDGTTLAMNMYEQIKNLGVEYRYGNVQNIKREDNLNIVTTDVEEISCYGVIIASGRSPKGLNLEKEEKLTGRGISYCATCDGALYKEKEVMVIGGGNSALEEALYLANICKKVTIVHRRKEFRADQYLVDKVKRVKNIKLNLEKEVVAYLEKENKLVGVVLKDNKTNKTRKQKTSAVFLFVGHTPNTSFLKEKEILTKDAYIVTDEQKKTKLPFVYAAGDVTKKELFQIVTATSDGAIAANSFIRDSKMGKK